MGRGGGERGVISSRLDEIRSCMQQIVQFKDEITCKQFTHSESF